MAPTNVRSASLRSKLAAAIAVPVAGMLMLGSLQVRTLTEESARSEAQLAVVESNVAIADIAGAIRNERDVQITVASLASPINRSLDGRNSYLERTRANTDGVISNALSSPSLTDQHRSAVEDIRSRLTQSRGAVGFDLHELRADLVDDGNARLSWPQ